MLIPTMAAARRHLSFEMSSVAPWISVKSRDWLRRGTIFPRIAFTSVSLLTLPVMKCNSLIAIVGKIVLALRRILYVLKVSLVIKGSPTPYKMGRFPRTEKMIMCKVR